MVSRRLGDMAGISPKNPPPRDGGSCGVEWQAGEDARRVKLRVMGARRVIPGSKVVRWSCVVNLGSHRGLITHIATMKRLEERRVAVRLQHEDR